ncbi:MAG TPA: type II and III secretion system protein family protein [Nitrospiria bacterium]
MLNLKTKLPIFFILLGLALPPQPAMGQESGETERFHLTVGHSRLINTPFKVTRVSVGSPATADVRVFSSHQIYVLGKGIGVTNLLIQGDGINQVMDLIVEADTTLLKEKFSELLPGENIQVYASKGSILLKGEVSSAPVLSTALAIAETFAPKNVVNLIQIGGLKQVLLEVRVAEVSRTALNRLNVNFQTLYNDFFAMTNLSGALNVTELVTAGSSLVSVETDISPSTNLIAGSTKLHTVGFLQALRENGLVRVLAEPNLIALSGREARFIAGGEFPIPVPSANAGGGNTIEFKEFGVQLAFTPTVLDSGKISLVVAPEVSEIDFSTAIQVGGFAVPGVSTRAASTTVELMDGHTFAIAGLIRDDARNLVSKFPVLGDIPVLGMLFRSTEFVRSETELVILVTPRLVQPMGDPETVSLPTDRYEVYEHKLMGLSAPETDESMAREDALSGGFEGPLGHSQ